MSELKQYPPSELKLERLRKAGVVPFSTELMITGVLLGLFLAVSLLHSMCETDLLDITVRNFSASIDGTPNKRRPYHEILRAAGLLGRGTAIILISLSGVVLLFGAVQTRFLLNPPKLSVNIGQTFRWRFDVFADIGRRLSRTIANLLVFAAWLALAALIIREVYFLPEHMPSWIAHRDFANVAGRADGLQSAQPSSYDLKGIDLQNQVVRNELAGAFSLLIFKLRGIWWSILLFAFFVGILARFLTVLGFRREHSMSRAELEAEFRESVPAAAYKEAREEFFAIED